jgi:hypothetical protein
MSPQSVRHGENKSGSRMLMSIHETAEQLCLSESTLRRRTKEGLLYSREAITAWIGAKEAA